MTAPNATPPSPASWLRALASYVDYSRFRRVWLHPITEQAEQGYLAACYEGLAQRANSEAEYFLAYDAANHGLRCAAAAEYPPHRLVSLKVTALARSGATEEAKRLMDQFLGKHEPDSGICSAQARLFRDLALGAKEPAERRRLFDDGARWAARAKECAREEGEDWAYPANQEAQFRFLAGERDLAAASALAVIDFVERRMDPGKIWSQTNLAEMHLVRGNLDQAGRHYKKAAQIGAGSPGDLAAVRSVAAVLLRELAMDGAKIDGLLEDWFPKPLLVVFAGHLPDAAGRPAPRLPEKLCRPGGPAAIALAARIRSLGAIEGVCASAPGGDILFAEALTAAGARLLLVDPFPRPRIESVAAATGQDWAERLGKVFHAAAATEPIACAEDANETAQCEYATHVMLGAAILRARRINANLQALVLWDETDADSPARGGTGNFVTLCREAGVPVEIINPNALSA